MSQNITAWRTLEAKPGCQLIGLNQLFNSKECRTYYVNNIVGSSSASGLSWNEAVDQVDAALLLAERQRIKGRTYNKVAHNRIIIQGTETAYSKVDQNANCVDIFGLGHRMHLGGAAGDVMISGGGSASGMAMTALAAGWDTTAGTYGGGLGVNIYNVHFEATGSYWAVYIYDWLLGSFEDCSFMCSGSNSTGGLGVREHFAGSLLRNCHAGGDAGLPQDGFNFTGGVFNQNLIEGNWAQARRYGFFVDDYLQGGTVVRNNTFYGTTYGLYDNSSETTVLGLAQYVNNNCVSAGTGMQVTNGSTTRCTGNLTNNNGSIDWAYTLSAQ